MNERLLVFLSLSIAGTGLLLLQSYKEYTHAAESLMTLLSIVSAALAIYQFLRKD